MKEAIEKLFLAKVILHQLIHFQTIITCVPGFNFLQVILSFRLYPDKDSFPFFILCEAIGCDLLYIVDHMVQEPLDVDLDLPPQCKLVHPFIGADIPEYLFYYGNPMGVDLTPFLTLDLLHHNL